MVRSPEAVQLPCWRVYRLVMTRMLTNVPRLCCIDGVQARLLELLGRLLELPANLDYLLSCGQLLPAFVRSTRVALDHCNSLEADEPSMMTGGEAASRLSMLLQVLVAVLEHTPSSAELVGMQEQLVSVDVFVAGECE